MARVEEYEIGEIRTDRGEFKDKGNWGVNPAHRDFAGRKDIADGVTDAYEAFVAADTWAQQYGLDLDLTAGEYKISKNLTLTSGVRMPRGAVLKPDSGVTVTVSGPFEAGIYQTFDVSAGGSVAFARGSVPHAVPQWFGAKGDNSTDDTSALQACFNSCLRVYLPGGRYRISSTLTKDATSFKLFGQGEDETRIMTLTGFSGDVCSDGYNIMLKLGNGTVSRYFNEIRNIQFGLLSAGDPNACAIYLNRVNNQSTITQCSFEGIGKGIEGINLALANVCAFNRFRGNTINIRLTVEAGNSWNIFGNYFSGGRVYFDDAMTDVKFSHNVTDGSFTMYSDGVSGLRGCQITHNRFESATTDCLSFGFVRGLQVHNNYFNVSAATALRFRSSGAGQIASVRYNRFEDSTTNYVLSALPAGALTLANNNDNSSAATGYSAAATYERFNGVESIGGTFAQRDNTRSHGSSPVKRTEWMGVTPISAFSTATKIADVTTSGVRGGYLCRVEGVASFSPNSTAVAARSICAVFSVTNANDGTLAISAVTEVYDTASAATASATRDLTDLTVTAVAGASSDIVEVRITATGTGSVVDLKFVGTIEVTFERYTAVEIS